MLIELEKHIGCYGKCQDIFLVYVAGEDLDLTLYVITDGVVSSYPFEVANGEQIQVPWHFRENATASFWVEITDTGERITYFDGEDTFDGYTLTVLPGTGDNPSTDCDDCEADAIFQEAQDAASSRRFFENDTAAKAGGVKKWKMYLLSADNTYFMPEGTPKVVTE